MMMFAGSSRPGPALEFDAGVNGREELGFGFWFGFGWRFGHGGRCPVCVEI